MKPLLNRGFHAFHLGLLRAASLLVPAGQRGEWHSEWYAELWHVREAWVPAGAFSWAGQRELTAFCLGAVPDAWCLQRQSWQPAAASPQPVPAAAVHGSAGQCVLYLTVVLVFCAILARLLPGVQAENDAARYQVAPGVILIQGAGAADDETPGISAAQFRDWRSRRQRYFDNFAFYRTARESRSLPGAGHEGRASKPTQAATWTVAHASFNLFALLGLPVQTAASDAAERREPALLLSHEAWLRDFAGNPQIAGSVIRIGGRPVRIAGVVHPGSWSLPGHPDAWLLEPEAQLAASAPSGAPGYVIAHLNPLGQSFLFNNRVSITESGPGDSDVTYDGVGFSNPVEGPAPLFEFALFLALLALPAVTSVSMSESTFSAHRPSWKKRLARWNFLAAKLILVAAIAYCASLDLAYGRSAGFTPWAECVQFLSGFTLCLFGLRWAVLDQHKRCPVCLRRVTHPAQVGLASRTFLGWNGTELMCMGGHTLLHVPALPTSWFAAPRWLYLDHSWDFLFAEPTVG